MRTKKMGRLFTLTALVALLIILGVVLLLERGVEPSGSTPYQSTELEDPDRDEAIRLDFHPFKGSPSLYVVLRASGESKVVRYWPHRYVVVSISHGALPEVDAGNLLSRAQDPVFRDAVRDRDFAGEGLSRGDQFRLSVGARGGPIVEAFGFVDDAPDAARTLVQDLVALAERVDRTSLAEAYLRSSPISKERVERLRKKGQVRLVPIHEFPQDLQPVLAEAMDSPNDFHALGRTQYEQLLSWRSHGHEFLVVRDGSGHQMSLYESRSELSAN